MSCTWFLEFKFYQGYTYYQPIFCEILSIFHQGFIYYDLNNAGRFVNLFKILQRTLKPEKITGAYLFQV